MTICYELKQKLTTNLKLGLKYQIWGLKTEKQLFCVSPVIELKIVLLKIAMKLTQQLVVTVGGRAEMLIPI